MPYINDNARFIYIAREATIIVPAAISRDVRFMKLRIVTENDSIAQYIYTVTTCRYVKQLHARVLYRTFYN